jgi:dTDP-4-dehydrorhamnose 3,5-epimerase
VLTDDRTAPIEDGARLGQEMARDLRARAGEDFFDWIAPETATRAFERARLPARPIAQKCRACALSCAWVRGITRANGWRALKAAELRSDHAYRTDRHSRACLVLTPARFGDARGFFSETWNRARLSENGIDIDFVQDNHSLSAAVGPCAASISRRRRMRRPSLVRCGRGALFDVAVDIRKGSPTYGRWFGIELTFENGKQLLIPAGFAHGFSTRAPDTEIIYKCSDTYAPEAEGALALRRPDIGIDWGLGETHAILSDKDAAAGAFAGFDSPFVYEETST